MDRRTDPNGLPEMHVLPNGETLYRIYYISWETGHEVLEVPRLRGGRFDGLKLHRAEMNRADFEGASFRGTNLDGAYLGACNLARTDFTDAHLVNALMYETDLRGAILRNCLIWGTTLHDANLRGADFSGCVGKPELRGATYDRSTVWPERLSSGGAWGRAR